MKQAVVFLRDRKAGVLTEDENGYTFQYDLINHFMIRCSSLFSTG